MQTWYNDEAGGTPIDADALNHIEQGIYDAAASMPDDLGISDIDGLQDALDDKQPAGSYQVAGDYSTSDDLSDLSDQVFKGAVFNVLSYGAKGDGATDDTAAFQSAIDAIAAAGGGTLWVPPKRYALSTSAVTTTVILRADHMTVWAYGATFMRPTAWQRAMFTCSTRTGQTGYGSGVRHLTWYGGTFQGSLKDSNYITPFGLHHAQYCTFRDIRIENCQAGGSHCFDLGGCEGIRVQNCTFLGTVDVISSGNNVAEAVQLDGSYMGTLTGGTENVGFDGLLTRDVVVENCNYLPFTDSEGTVWPCANALGAHFMVEGKYYDHIRFLNNYIKDPRTCPVVSGDPTATRGVVHLPTAKDVVIANNTFVRTVADKPCSVIRVEGVNTGVLASADPSSSGAAKGTFATPVVPTDITIKDNVIQGFNTGVTTSEMECILVAGVDATNGAGSRVTVRGNQISNSYSSSASTHAFAIKLTKITEASVSENTVINSYGAIRLETDCERVTVVNNKIRTTNYKPIHLYGVTFCSVQGNVVSDYNAQLHIDGGSTDCAVIGNNLSNPASGFTGTATGAFTTTRIMIIGNFIVNTGDTLAAAIGANSGLTHSALTQNFIVGYTNPTSAAPDSTTISTGNFIQ